MTKTSEGPAGMSIDTIASLFCNQITMRITNTMKMPERHDGHALDRKSRINLKNHFSSCDILVAGPEYFLNLPSQ
jgi:hypothetical protein